MTFSKKEIFWMMAGFGGLSLFLNRTSFEINVSESLPDRAFLVFKDITPQRGDYVAIRDYTPTYRTYPHIVKRLVGVAGDHILHKEDGLYVEDTCVGRFLKQTHKGETLTPIFEQVIPEGFVFVMADHPDSFDSRYKEFGLVPVSSIYGKAIGFF